MPVAVFVSFEGEFSLPSCSIRSVICDNTRGTFLYVYWYIILCLFTDF